MTDPISALQELPPESPPKAVVLSAVRIFRYRVIAVIAMILATVLGLGWALSSFRPGGVDRDLARLLADADAQIVVLGSEETVEGVQVKAVELVWNEDRGFIQVVSEETIFDREEIEIIVEINEVRIDGVVAWSDDQSPLNLQEISERFEQISVWIPVSISGTPETIEVDVRILPVPREVSENGGVVSGGVEGTVRYEEGAQP